LQVQPDPAPLRNVFIRSDQYSFVRRGIPSVMIDVAAAPRSAEATTLKEWRTQHYHAPSDDADQPVDLVAAATYEELIRALTIELADNPVKPAWKPTSFFSRYAGGAGR
jgi:Zn-dependent M28 family amino/carboxypeptidase